MDKPGGALPDEILVIAAILGDFEAFNELALRYRAAVVRTAQAIVGMTDAEDIAQDALLLAFKALPSIDDPTRFGAWLKAITRNRALRFIGKEQRRRKGRVELDEVLLERLGALSQPFMEIQETRAALHEGLDQLPEDYALVLRLRFFDAVPLKRIAAFLGVPESTVKWRVFRGKQLLRNVLDQADFSEETWNVLT